MEDESMGQEDIGTTRVRARERLVRYRVDMDAAELAHVRHYESMFADARHTWYADEPAPASFEPYARDAGVRFPVHEGLFVRLALRAGSVYRRTAGKVASLEGDYELLAHGTLVAFLKGWPLTLTDLQVLQDGIAVLRRDEERGYCPEDVTELAPRRDDAAVRSLNDLVAGAIGTAAGLGCRSLLDDLLC
jgi:hypothetical protein